MVFHESDDDNGQGDKKDDQDDKDDKYENDEKDISLGYNVSKFCQLDK